MIWLYRIGLVDGMSPSVEWWNEQVDGWLYTMLWEPHYTCALIACLTGFLIVWSLPPQASRRQRVVSGLVAGMALATAAGCGIYVAMVFAVFLGIWFVLTLLRRHWAETETLAVAAISSIALIGPFLLRLNSSSQASGPPLIQFTIRSFAPAEMALRLFRLDRPWQQHVADLLSLPLNYFVELGLFFVVGRIAWTRFRRQKRPATRAELAAFLMAAVSILIWTFLKSSIIANNDLAWRGFLPAQFILLLCAADVLSERASFTPLLRLLLILGVAGVVYDLAIVRFYPLLSDMGKVPTMSWLGRDRQLGLRTAANRDAYEWLRSHTPETAVIQQNPQPFSQDVFYGTYGERQTVAVGAACGSTFGGDPRECDALTPALTALFSGGGAPALESACRALPMDFVVAKDADAAWHDRASWVWTADAIFHNDFVRLFACHPH
jgi:hypothetical protein